MTAFETWAEFHTSFQFLNLFLFFCFMHGLCPGLHEKIKKIPFSSSVLSIVLCTPTPD